MNKLNGKRTCLFSSRYLIIQKLPRKLEPCSCKEIAWNHYLMSLLQILEVPFQYDYISILIKGFNPYKH